jgi:hypothetical protein
MRHTSSTWVTLISLAALLLLQGCATRSPRVGRERAARGIESIGYRLDTLLLPPLASGASK